MKTSNTNKAKKRKNRNDNEQGAPPPEPARECWWYKRMMGFSITSMFWAFL